jgi:hypothetical protein
LPGYAPLEAIRGLAPHASVLITKGCTRAYAPDPATSICSNAWRQGSMERLGDVAHRYPFQYAVIPADWDADDRNNVFGGWKVDEIYSDDDWRALRIIRGP